MRREEVMRLFRYTRQLSSWVECGDAVMRTVVASSQGSRGRTSRVSTRQSRRTTGRCGGDKPIRYGSSEQRECTRKEGAMH